LERLRQPDKRLPKTGGLNATVVVTMQLDTLMGGLEGSPPRHRHRDLPRPGQAAGL